MTSINMDLLDSNINMQDITNESQMRDEEFEDSISSDEDYGADGAIKMTECLWSEESIVSNLKDLDSWGVGELLMSGHVRKALETDVAGRGVLLLWACWLGEPEALLQVLKAGADPKQQDSSGRSGLHLACLVGSSDCVALLLEYGAIPNCWDRAHKSTPLHCAASSRSLSCVQVLIKHGADVNAGIDDRSPLHYAVQSEALDCVKELLTNGAKPDNSQDYSETPLHMAAALGNSGSENLLYNGARSDGSQEQPESSYFPAGQGYLHCALELLSRGASPNALNVKRQSPLHLACIAQSLDMVELLLARGASTSVRDLDGRTPLHASLGRSARSGDCARALLVAGADPNMPDNYGYTSVHLAALNEFSSRVMMLLDYGGDVTMRTKGDHSALSFIVRRTPEVLPGYIRKFDDSIRVIDREIGDVDCEFKLDFRTLVPHTGRMNNTGRKPKSESSLLLSFVEVGRRDVLKHPLCETFLYLKWKRIRKFFIATLVYHAILVICFSFYIFSIFLQSCSDEDSKVKPPPPCEPPIQVKLLGIILMFLNCLLLFKEVFQIVHQRKEYIIQWENWLQIAIMFSVFVCTAQIFVDSNESQVGEWQHHVAALGIFLSWLELMLIVGRFPMFGLYLHMFATVAMNFTKFLMAYSCLLIAFGLSFAVLFPNVNSFGNTYLSLMKTIIMMTGELEFEDIFYGDEIIIKYPFTSHLMFLAFVFLVTLILTNLLVGLAVSDIQELRESAGMDRLMRQAVQVARLEELLFSPLLQWLPKKMLALMHQGALLLSDSYNWALIIRPNDPRENRIPKYLISSIYKLVAERKDQGKTTKKVMCKFQRNVQASINSTRLDQNMVKKRSLYRSSGISNYEGIKLYSGDSARKQKDIGRQVEELAETVQALKDVIEKKMEILQTLVDATLKKQES